MARRHFAIVAFLLAAAAPLSAQSIAAAPVPSAAAVPAAQPVSFAPAAGPTYSAMTVAAHTSERVDEHVISAAARGGDVGQAKAMMIVGAAAFLAGAVIGNTPGTIVMVGGAVVGLVGLYDYLQQ